MGWFWADSSPHTTIPRQSDASPPPECPMHKRPKSSSIPPHPSASTSSTAATTNDSSSACPYKPSSRSTTISKLNSLNYMPSLPNARESTHQKVHLPTEREASTIPKGDGTGNWEYPSPQQMYNALLRKGYDDTPADAVESMVAVHNFLNEGAWAEIRAWERTFAGGLAAGWRRCSGGGGQSGAWEAAAAPSDSDADDEPKLVRFMGRPGDLSPKARAVLFAGWLWPSRFSAEPPFDRHDWYVSRRMPDGSTREVRYVIDYYSGPPEPTGEPVFYLDVRPAVDGPTAAVERMMKWSGDVWYRGSGAAVREAKQREKLADEKPR